MPQISSVAFALGTDVLLGPICDLVCWQLLQKIQQFEGGFDLSATAENYSVAQSQFEARRNLRSWEKPRVDVTQNLDKWWRASSNLRGTLTVEFSQDMRLKRKAPWLTQAQMGELIASMYGVSTANTGRTATRAKFAQVQTEGHAALSVR